MKNKKSNKKITSIATTALLCLSLSSNTFAAMEFSTAVSDADKGKLNGTLILGSYKFPISTNLADYTLASTSTGQVGVEPIIYQYNRYKNGGSWVDYYTGEVIPIPEKIIITHERLKNGEPFVEAGTNLPWSNSITIPATAYTKGMYNNGILKIGLITYDVSNADAKAKFEQLESEASTKTNFFSVSGGVVIIESSGSSEGDSLTDEQINQLKGTLQELINSAQRLLDENPEAGLSDIKKNKRKTVEDKKTAAENFLKGEITVDGLLTNLQDLSTAINAFYKDDAEITGVTITDKVDQINQGDSYTFKANVAGTNDYDKTVTWSVYGEGATIDQTGKLTVAADAVIGTELKVKATANGDNTKFAETTVKVIDKNAVINVTGVKLDKNTASVKVRENITLTATVEPANATNKAVTWESDKTNIATVDANGVVTGVKAGTATITVKTADGGFEATCIVTVTEQTGEITGVTITDKVDQINQGDSYTFKANVAGKNDYNKTVTWSVYGEGATIDQTGKLTVAADAVIGTELKVKATANGDNTKFAETTVKVIDKNAVINVTGVKLDKNTASVKVRENITLTATVEPANATNKAVTWESDKTNIATVDANGVVTGVKAGTATITVKTADGGFEATCIVTVTDATQDKINSVTIVPKTANVNQGGTKQFKVTVDATGNIDKSVSWAVYEGNVSAQTEKNIITVDTQDPTKATLNVPNDADITKPLIVKVTSNADNTKSDTANVTVVKVDKTALNSAINTAEAAKVNVVIADDASNVAKGVYFVNQATMTTFETAIKDAKDVKDNADATQEQVKKATTDLTTATTTFNNAKQVGTKETGVTEKGTYTGNLISVTSNDTTVTDAVYKTVYSEVYVGDTTTLKFKVKKDGVFSTSSNSQDVKVTKIGDKSVANYATKGSESTIEKVTFIEYTYTLQTGEIFDTTKNIEIELKDKTDNNKTYIITFGTFQKK